MAKNRSNKTSITFNPDARREFLTGFSRRKQERKKKAQIKKLAQQKEEIRQARLALRQRGAGDDASGDALEANMRQDQIASQSVLDAGSHTVTVTHVDTFQQNFKPEIRPTSGAKEGPSKEALNKLKRLQMTKVKGPGKSTKSASKAKKFDRKSTKSKRTKHFHPKKITS